MADAAQRASCAASLISRDKDDFALSEINDREFVAHHGRPFADEKPKERTF
jgi:hypothetical protein